jgi:hypothetical protein
MRVVTARGTEAEVPQGADGEPGGPRAAQIVFGMGGGIASIVYGTITAMATVTAFGNEKDPWKLAGLVAATAIVFWIAHVYAHAISESIAEQGTLRPATVASIAHREFGIVLAAVLPVTVLVLGAIGVFNERRAVWYALFVGLATLAVEGARYARLERLRLRGTLIAIASNVILGLFVVALKVGVSH